jgi:hypothetical protein
MNSDGLLHQEPPVACLPPNPYHTSSASAGAGAALNSARVGMDDDALNSALGAPLGALEAPGAAAATAEWSAPLYYLSAAWHLSQADAFAGALASDLGRTVHEVSDKASRFDPRSGCMHALTTALHPFSHSSCMHV